MYRPNGNTSPWSKALLRMYDFPLRQEPAIDTTQTGPSGRSILQKYKFIDPFIDMIRKQLYLRIKELKDVQPFCDKPLIIHLRA